MTNYAEQMTDTTRLTLVQELEKERGEAILLLERADDAFEALYKHHHLDREALRLWHDIREFLRDAP
jgi:hypothetical protein